jgi:hypothetical protein
MTLGTKHIVTVSVTKRPDGRLVLSCTRAENAAVLASSGKRQQETSPTTSIESGTAPAGAAPTIRDAATDGPQDPIPSKADIEALSMEPKATN